MLCGYLVSLLLCQRLALRFRAPETRWETSAASSQEHAAVIVGLTLLIGLASTLLFLASHAYVYHEALMWGAAFAIACYERILRYAASPSTSRLLAACAFAALSFFSRASVGAGPVLAIGLVALSIALRRSFRRGARPPRRDMLIAGATVGLVVAGFAAINFAKFRTYFDATPMSLYWESLHTAGRFDNIQGKQCRTSNIPTAIRAYFSPDSMAVRPWFPWVALATRRHTVVYPAARYSVIEPHASLTATTPVLAMLAALGVFGIRKHPDAIIPLVGAAFGGAIMLAADGLTERYLHDMFPLLAVSGALGLNGLLAIRPAAVRHAIWFVAAPVVLWSICVHLSITLR
jgi:hypothetical protein